MVAVDRHKAHRAGDANCSHSSGVLPSRRQDNAASASDSGIDGGFLLTRQLGRATSSQAPAPAETMAPGSGTAAPALGS